MKLLKPMIDAYLLFNTDQHGSEMPNEDQLLIKKITGFTGSNAIVLLMREKNYLFTDGRYFLQAEKELKKDFILKRMGVDETLTELMENLQIRKFAADFKRMEGHFLKSFQDKFENLKILLNSFSGQPIQWDEYEKIFSVLDEGIEEQKNENIQFFNIELFSLSTTFSSKIENLEDFDFPILFNETEEKIFNKNLSGEKQSRILSTEEKLKKLFEKQPFKKLILSDLNEIAYLCNIRGADITYSLLPYAYAIVSSEHIELFISEKIKLEKKLIMQKNYFNFYNAIEKLDSSIFISKKSNAYLMHKFQNKTDQLELLMMEKSYFEIRGFFKANLVDCLALIKFFSTVFEKNWTEKELSDKLIQMKKIEEEYLGESFPPIFGADENGAMIHHSTGNGLFNNYLLIDQGSQYRFGTTDITRTISRDPSEKFKQDYTNVLRGQILGKMARGRKRAFKNFVDVLPRLILNRNDDDYDHGTGHGIAYVGNVHEPSNFGKHNIVTVEPGIYRNEKYGIRLEDDVLIEKRGEFFFIKDMTYMPYQKNLILTEQLSREEINYLNAYNKTIRELYLDKLEGVEKEYLLRNTEKI